MISVVIVARVLAGHPVIGLVLVGATGAGIWLACHRIARGSVWETARR
jgi:hypothetical protein